MIRHKVFCPKFLPLLSLTVFLIFAAKQSNGAPIPDDLFEKISGLLQKIISAPPDICGAPPMANLDPDDVELSILRVAADETLHALNAGEPELNKARDQATVALKKIEGISSQFNAKWPQENRFHFQLIDVAPALVLKVGIGTHEQFFVIGIPEMDGFGKANRLWRVVGEEDLELEHTVPRSWLDVYPLHRGPSGHTRFLVAIGYTGCAGSSGVLYDAREWNPGGLGELDTVISQKGAVGMDESFTGGKPTSKDPFMPVGKLETKGRLITLPYCWFSAIDTWDNPSLCALDTYDVSGDAVRFRSRSYNRPDLVPVAKAIEYAEKHDYPAVRAYCSNADIARRIVRDITPSYSAGDLHITRKADGSEQIEMGSPGVDKFDVQKIVDQWLVTRYSPSPD
jgi:hypothetical protein